MNPEEQVLNLPLRTRGNYSKCNFKPIRITTNLSSTSFPKRTLIYIFSIHYTPNIPSDHRSLRMKLHQKLLPELQSQIMNPIFGGFNVYSMDAPKKKEAEYQIQNYKIRVKMVKEVLIENEKILLNFLNSGLKQIMIQLGYYPFVLPGKYFQRTPSRTISGLRIYSGFKANFVIREAGLFLRIDPVDKFTQNISVLAAINEIYSQNKGKQREQVRMLVKQSLLNCIIMTNYGKFRYEKVIDVEFISMKDQIIQVKQQFCSVYDYYKNRYNIQIQKVNQPLLVVENRKKQKNKSYLIPELCNLTGIPENIEEFTRKQISQTSRKTCTQRSAAITGLLKQITNTQESNCLANLGFEINRVPAQIKAQIIPPPQLRLANSTVPQGFQHSFNLFKNSLYDSSVELKCAIISFHNVSTSEFIYCCQQTATNLKLKLKLVKHSLGKFQNHRALDCIKSQMGKVSKQCNIVLIILPNALKKMYKYLKAFALKSQLNSQFVLEMVFNKNKKSIYGKILLQMAAKVGNILWSPKISDIVPLNVMLIGLDSSKCGGFKVLTGVGSRDNDFGNFWTVSQKFEINSDKYLKMKIITLQLVRKFVNSKNTLPSQIIIFVNGMCRTEANLYRQYFAEKTFQDLRESFNTNIKLSVIIIKSNGFQRFFMEQSNQGSFRNIPAGTVISENVVGKNYDFYLSSQNSNSGTLVPNHYQVIFSSSQLEEGVLQQLIFSQCFNYCNWTGCIKIPSVLQYAKKCCRLHSQLNELASTSNSLKNNLYFI